MTEGYEIEKEVLLELLNNAEAFVGIIDVSGVIIYANASSLAATGLKLTNVVGQKFWESPWWTGEEKDAIKADFFIACKGETTRREIRFNTLNGMEWAEFKTIPVLNDLAELQYVVVEGSSIEKRKQAETNLEATQLEYEHFFDDLDVAFLLLGNEGYVKCNAAAVKMLGYVSEEQVLGMNPSQLSPEKQPDGQESIKKASEMIALGYQKGSHRFDWSILKADGELLDIDATVTPVSYEGGIVLHCCWRDLTDTNIQQKALELSEKRYKSLFEGTADATFLAEAGVFSDCNLAAVKMLGYNNKAELLGLHPAAFSPLTQDDGRNSLEKVNVMIKQAYAKGSNRFEWQHKRKNGEVFPAEVLLTAVSVGEKKVLHVVIRDITEAKKHQYALQQMAHYDSLTGLPNRVLFVDRFHLATARSKRTNTKLAVCFLDLDNFKPINDTFGHDIGDKLLIEVAGRINRSIRDEDTVSRQGGDEFTLLLGGLDSYQECEQLINRMLHSLCEPYIIENQVHSISASCGITLYPSDDGDIDTLVRHADQAMYQAKLQGKNTFAFFDTETEQSSQQHMAFLARVSKAVSLGELVLFYQPKVNILTGKMFGIEALIRWQHPKDGLLSPDTFLPKIENTEVIIEVGKWVIEQALLQIEEWSRQGKNWVVSINIDAYHFMQTGFVEDLQQALARYPTIEKGLLEIEILETVAFSDLIEVADIITQCQSMGVSFALDDFGTGYSSLAYLKGLPVEWLKIDRSFVRDMLEDAEDLALIEGVILLAKAFKRNIIAEGVETSEQAVALLKLGCHNVQGYGFAKPMPVNNIIEWEANFKLDEELTDYKMHFLF